MKLSRECALTPNLAVKRALEFAAFCKENDHLELSLRCENTQRQFDLYMGPGVSATGRVDDSLEDQKAESLQAGEADSSQSNAAEIHNTQGATDSASAAASRKFFSVSPMYLL